MTLIIIAVILGGWMMWTLLGITGASLLLWVALAMQLHTRCTSTTQGFARVEEEEEAAEAV